MKRFMCIFLAVVTVLLCGFQVLAATQGIITGAAVPNATMYELYLHYEGIFTLMATSDTIDFDLMSLDLEPGEHQFAVRATAPGFEPSFYSNIVTYTVSAGEAFAVYSATDNSLTFYKNNDTVTTGSTYKGKVATAVYTGIETTDYFTEEYGYQAPWRSYCWEITSVSVVDEISPVSTARWFANFQICNVFDLENLDTSNVTNMQEMFAGACTKLSDVSVNLSCLNTEKVTSMQMMFMGFGGAGSVSLTGLDKWDVSNVCSMNQMFDSFAYDSTDVTLNSLSGWDVSNVTDMYRMFRYCAYSDSWFFLDISSWDVSSVTSYTDIYKGSLSKINGPIFE